MRAATLGNNSKQELFPQKHSVRDKRDRNVIGVCYSGQMDVHIQIEK